ncbi:MAG: hypothetical protein ACLFN8_04490 [Candidatus Woesearchaeota archaeon]
MRYNKQMHNLMNSPNYPYANILLKNILRKEEPTLEVLTHIHGDRLAPAIKSTIMQLYDDPTFKIGKLREHENAPEYLSKTRKLIDQDFDFQAIEQYISPINNKEKDAQKTIVELEQEINLNIGKNIKNKYGAYTPNIIKTLAHAKQQGLKRKSKISKSAHWLGVSATMYFLEQEQLIPPHPIKNYRVAVSFMHDLFEDTTFAKEVIPKDKKFIQDIDLLTNPYNSVSKTAQQYLKYNKKEFNTQNFKEYTQRKINSRNIPKEIKKLHQITQELLSEPLLENLEGAKLAETFSWRTYEFYVNRLWSESIKNNDDTAIISKFCDQSYNFIGKSKLSDEESTKNMLKLWLWPSTVYSSAINKPYLNNFVMELLEDALCYSEYLVTRDLMNEEAQIPHHISAFENIKKLSPIFYRDKKIKVYT